MKIPSTGNYLTEDKQTAIVEELGENLCLGRIAHRQGAVFWDRHTGLAYTGTHRPLPLSMTIVSPAPIPWRERIIQLIETAELSGPAGGLSNGGLALLRSDWGVLMSRPGTETITLQSPEFIGAYDARESELLRARRRAIDDANAAAIEALLQ